MTNTDDIPRLNLIDGPYGTFLGKASDGDYVTYEDHVEALAKARDNALVEASETLSGFFDIKQGAAEQYKSFVNYIQYGQHAHHKQGKTND